MNTDNRPLTKEELIEVTGYQLPSRQYQVLRESGVFAIFRKPTNSVFTTWYHVFHPNNGDSLLPQDEVNEPDFGALKSA